MSFQAFKNFTVSLFILNFCLAAFQIFSLINASLSLTTALLMMFIPLLLIFYCKKVASLPELLEVKDLRWQLKGIKNLKWELLLLLLTGIIPLIGVIFMNEIIAPDVSLSDSIIVDVLVQGCILLGICWQIVLSKDCLGRFLRLTENFNPSNTSKDTTELKES